MPGGRLHWCGFVTVHEQVSKRWRNLSRLPDIGAAMNPHVARPNAQQLRQMAKSAPDPVIRQALLELAEEYERSGAPVLVR